jgi:TfoX/Sxy family transcriptional regulator of competence genes
VPFDTELADRVRALLPGLTEKRMFGGIGLMERGNMVAGVLGNDLLLRVPPDETDRWLREPGAHPMRSGRTMRGWVMVAHEAVPDRATLSAWIARSRAAAKKLPAK